MEKIIDLPEEKKFGPHDDHTLVRIGEEVTERLDVIAAKLFVTQTKRQKRTCPCCEQFVIRAEPESSVLPTAQRSPAG